jgi:hypothetical protein
VRLERTIRFNNASRKVKIQAITIKNIEMEKGSSIRGGKEEHAQCKHEEIFDEQQKLPLE